MITPSVCSTFLWTAWVVAWLLAAWWSARTVARESSASRLAYAVLMGAGWFLMFFRPGRFGALGRSLFPPAEWIAWLGVALIAIGLGFTGWARVQIGRFWSGTVTLKEGHELVRSGPYAVTRHPIYTGLLLALIGTWLTRGTLVGILGLTLVILGIVLKVRLEERLLLSHFGDAYQAYRAQVPALIPRPR
jgi:protein-S-isoprenylcysteine O-methyltransferase Ste14